MNSVEKKTHVDRLAAFVFTMDEYEKLANTFPIRWELKPGSIDCAVESAALNLRALLIRKYITRTNSGSPDHKLWVKDVIASIRQVSPNHAQRLDGLESKYEQAYNSGEYALSDGSVLKMNELFEDIIYGIYLHSDGVRIERLLKTDQAMMHQALRRYIQPIEDALYELMSIIRDLGLHLFERHVTPYKASVIALGSISEESHKGLLGHWSNMYGKYAEDEEAIDNLYKNKSDQDRQILTTALQFFKTICNPESKTSDIKDLVLNGRLSDWGDLSEVKSFIKDIPGLGVASMVNYNHRNDVAYVKLLKHIDDTMLISEEQIIPDVTYITLVEDVTVNEWRVFSLGGEKEPYLGRS